MLLWRDKSIRYDCRLYHVAENKIFFSGGGQSLVKFALLPNAVKWRQVFLVLNDKE